MQTSDTSIKLVVRKKEEVDNRILTSQHQIPANWVGNAALSTMFIEVAGYLKFRRPLFIETSNNLWGFRFNATTIPNEIPTDEDIETELELEDTSPRLQELIETDTHPEI